MEPAAGKYTAEYAGREIGAQGNAATQVIRYDASAGRFETHPVGTLHIMFFSIKDLANANVV
jgi:hypothetical protein